MDITEIRNRILTDGGFVLKELDTITSYYQLKHTIR